MSSPSSTIDILSRNQIVRAGAGAGKTTQLTKQVLEVIEAFRFKHGRYPHLVVTTFTRKATQELRERLALKAFESQDESLLEYMTSPVRLHISTIHGVMNLFLKKYAHLFHVDPAFKVLSSKEGYKLGKRVLNETLTQNPMLKELLQEFSFSRLAILCQSYYESKLYSENITYFKQNDFQELMRSKISEYYNLFSKIKLEILNQTNDLKWVEYVNTVNSLFELALKNSQWDSELSERFKSVRKPSLSKKSPQVSEEIDEELKVFLKDFRVDINSDYFQSDHWSKFEKVFKKFENLGNLYTEKILEHKKSQALFEMKDLELFTNKIIDEYPDVAKAFSSEWDYWLIDEFQDTSPLQVKLLQHMIGRKPHFIVGDPQQSIYLFRGAESSVFSEKEKQFKENQDGWVQLDKNYRSDPELLLFFNDLFYRAGDEFTPMQPREPLKEDQICKIFFNSYEKVDVPYKEYNEALGIVEHVLSLTKQGIELEKICVLGRTNHMLTRISQELKKFYIPTHVHASSGFYHRREVLDALSLLKFLVNPKDNHNLVLLLRTPYFKISDSEIVNHVKGYQYSLWGILVKELSDHPVILRLLKLKEKVITQGYSEVFSTALVESGFFDVSYQYDSTGLRESNLWKLIIKLKEEEKSPGFKILDFVNGKIKEIQENSMNEESNAVASLEPNCVNLMTVHASKGLEFDHVILPYLHKKPRLAITKEFHFNWQKNKWSFPILSEEGDIWIRSIADRLFIEDQRQKESKESLRVLYVAATRAKKSIYFSWTEQPENNSWAEYLLNTILVKSQLGINEREDYQFEFYTNKPLPDLTSLNLQNEKSNIRKIFHAQRPFKDPFSKHSVTSLLDKPEKLIPKATLTNQMDLYKRLSQSAEGTLVHKLMEGIYYQHQLDFTSMAEQWFGEKSQKVISAVQYVKSLQKPPIMKIMKYGQVEWGFQRLTNQGVLEGQIDLWGFSGEDKKELWVIDYKTGSMAYIEKAFQQLNYYASALKKHTGASAIYLAVIFPFLEKVEIRSFEEV